MDIRRKDNENIKQFQIRLCDNKDSYKLTWQDIADIMNKETGFTYSQDKYRKYYYAYEDGREDEKNKYVTCNNNKKVLVMSDLHIPDHNEEMILDTVRKNKEVDLIILNGDILDCKAVSSWFDEDITILDREMIVAHQLLTKIRNITKAKIVLVKGNHEARVNNFYAKNSKVMGSAVVETEILFKLANGFTIKRRKEHKREVYEPIENVEYCEARSYAVGDLLVNHPSMFRKDYVKTVQVMYQEKLKTKYPFANVFICGHTHQLGLAYIENGKVIAECGCMCNPMSYADKDDRPMRLQQKGYIYLEMKENKVQLDSIRVHSLGFDEIVETSDEIDTDF